MFYGRYDIKNEKIIYLFLKLSLDDLDNNLLINRNALNLKLIHIQKEQSIRNLNIKILSIKLNILLRKE